MNDYDEDYEETISVNLFDDPNTKVASKDEFEFFCRTMGLNNDQIRVILNSTYSNENKVEDFLDGEKYELERLVPVGTLLKQDKRQIASELLGYWPKNEKEAMEVFDTFERTLKDQNISLEQYVAIRKYTDYTNYKDINKYLRFEEDFKKSINECIEIAKEIINYEEKSELYINYICGLIFM